MKRTIWRQTREKGFTLVELLVVMSIMAVLAAVVIPTVTGVNTVARNTAQPQDINELQNAVTHFNADSSTWPTRSSAGTLPSTAYSTSGGVTTFTTNTITAISFTASYNSKSFVPDYASTPKHASDTVAVPTTNLTITVNRQGVTSTVVLSNTAGSSENWPAWAVDSKGGVWNFIDKDSY